MCTYFAHLPQNKANVLAGKQKSEKQKLEEHKKRPNIAAVTWPK